MPLAATSTRDTPSLVRFVAPGDYLQGCGALAHLPDLTRRHAGPAWYVSDVAVASWLTPRLQALVDSALQLNTFDGEITYAAIDAMAARVPNDVGVIVGIGGGKAIDMAKGVAVAHGLPMISVPTVASNDAPTSRAYAIYDDQHRMVAVERMPANPVAVLVDIDVLIGAPVRMMSAGIGDALAKWFEADAAAQADSRNMLGATAPALARVIARAAYDTLRQDAVAALAAMRRGTPDAAFGQTVEACLLMSGLGFENGGLSVAHAMTRGLMRSRHGHGALHGEHVAYGVMVQLVLEGRDDATLADMASFLAAVGLPSSLRTMSGKTAMPQDFDDIAAASLLAPHWGNFARRVDGQCLVQALRSLESMTFHASGSLDR
ncbi:iron-containing alcohol dehydrogenase [Pandoraea bronchicola]|uniref:Glycerol dehydrogenase n=1 Tax=Pandoraea bronchicola TaxID=2508287 RepID=A0A5E5BXK5_9BURK|nr:iron-containing alcohol dehydrogenase [Pandoraea bronchicola]VVE89852.1 Glycerol dehydrogenase [Pandoraea bronchicola]